MSPVHGVHGTEEWARCADGHVDDTMPFNRKQVIQQVFDAACTASIDVRQMVPNDAIAYTHCLVGVA